MPAYKAAIEAMCKTCIFDPNCPGTWREQVRDCTSPNCPLYELRPQPISILRGTPRRRHLPSAQGPSSSIRPEAGVTRH